MTGVPVLLNTSFNVKGEPIVERPHEAVECFLTTGIDYLALHDLKMTKNSMHKVLSPIVRMVAGCPRHRAGQRHRGPAAGLSLVELRRRHKIPPHGFRAGAEAVSIHGRKIPGACPARIAARTFVRHGQAADLPGTV